MALEATAGAGPDRADTWQVGVNWTGSAPTGELRKSGNLSVQLAQRTLMANLPARGGGITVRLRLADNQHDEVQGRSAELVLALAAMLAALGSVGGAHGRLLSELRPPFAATGLLEQGKVGAVDNVAAKLDAAQQALADAPDGRIFVPRANEHEIPTEHLQRDPRIVLVDSLQQALEVLKADALGRAQQRRLKIPHDTQRALLALRAPLVGNPFRSLQAFGVAECAQFFGRDREIQNILARLPSDPAQRQLPGVLIAGPSGCGKSSLMRAGVLGRVLFSAPSERQFLPRGTLLQGAAEPVWKPQAQAEPTEQDWAQSMAEHWERWLGVTDLPRHSLQVLGEALAQMLAERRQRSPVHWVLAIDQLEQLVSQTRDDDRPRVDELLRRLQKCLQQLAQAGVWVLATVREEYFGRMLATLGPSLPQQLALGSASPEQHQDFLSKVIDGPCRLAGIEREPQLLDALRTDAQDPSSVPLLEFALDALYSQAQMRAEKKATKGAANTATLEPLKLLLADYEDMRRLQGAIDKRAQELLKEQRLQVGQKVLGMLGRMARRAEGSTVNDRRYVRAPLWADAEEAELLEPWIDARLVVRGQAHLEVAHEAVLNHFKELRYWIEQHEALLQWRQEHLLPQMAQWLHARQDPQWMLDKRHLPRAQEALKVAELLSANEQQYILLSEQEFQRLQQDEAERETRRLQELQEKTEELQRRKAEVDQANAELTHKAEALEELARVASRRLLESKTLQIAAEDDGQGFDANHSQLLAWILATRVSDGGSGTPKTLLGLRGADALGWTRWVRKDEDGPYAPAIAFSPDGRQIVSGNHTLRLWDAMTGEPLGELKILGGARIVAFSPDGRRIVAGSTDYLYLWDAATNQLVQRIDRHALDVLHCLGFSHDGRWVHALDSDGILSRYDAMSGEALVGHSPTRRHEKEGRRVARTRVGEWAIAGYIARTLRRCNSKFSRAVESLTRTTAAALSPVWAHIAAVGDELGTLHLCDNRDAQPIAESMRGHEWAINSVAFSPDGRRIVSGSLDKTLRLWDARTGQPLGPPMRGHELAVNTVAFSPDGLRIVSGSTDRTLRLWDAATGQPLGEPMPGHEATIVTVAFSPDGRQIVSGSDDGTVRLWDVTPWKPLGEPMRGHEEEVLAVTFSPDSRWMVSGSRDHTLRLWDAATGQPLAEPMRGHQHWVDCVAISPDGRQVVSGSTDGTLRLWDAATGQPLGDPMLVRASSLAFLPHSRHFVSCEIHGTALGKTLRVWDATTGQQLGQPIEVHEMFGSGVVAFSPDGRRCVSHDGGTTLRLFDATTGQPLGKCADGVLASSDKEQVWSVAFSPDGQQIVSGNSDGTLRLWDATTGQPMGPPMRGHHGCVTSVTFSPDGRRVVSGSTDYTLQLWDAKIGQPLGPPMHGHEGRVNCVAFSPDGRRIISGSADKSLRLWRTEQVVADDLCELIGRNPTPAEWQAWGLDHIPDKPMPCPKFPTTR